MLLEAFEFLKIDDIVISVNVTDFEFFFFDSLGGEGDGDVEVGESSGFFFQIVFEGVKDAIEFGLSVGHW